MPVLTVDRTQPREMFFDRRIPAFPCRSINQAVTSRAKQAPSKMMRTILAYTLTEVARGETVAKARVERVGEPSQPTRQTTVVVTIVVVVIVRLCCWEGAPH
jgi:hypothetical protein